MIIDTHSHVFAPEYLELLARPQQPTVATRSGRDWHISYSDTQKFVLSEDAYHPAGKLERMDRLGIDVAVETHEGGRDVANMPAHGDQSCLDPRPIDWLLDCVGTDTGVNQGTEPQLRGDAFIAEDMGGSHGRAPRRSEPVDRMRRASTAAPTPLSTLTTAIPGAQELNSPCSAVMPPCAAP